VQNTLSGRNHQRAAVQLLTTASVPPIDIRQRVTVICAEICTDICDVRVQDAGVGRASLNGKDPCGRLNKIRVNYIYIQLNALLLLFKT
jgi:hypothetical protein